MLRFLALALGVCLFLTPVAGNAKAAPAQRWIVVSDIHFDPLVNPHLADRLVAEPAERWRGVFLSEGGGELSDFGHDTNDALLESALDGMRSTVADPEVIFVTGDLLGHHFREHFDAVVKAHDDASYTAFVDRTIDFLALEFREAFPHSRILPAVGNNDGYCKDYASTPLSPFLAHMAAAWAPAADANDEAGFIDQFSIGGYYAIPLPAGNAQAIVLNDVFWSSQYTNACGDAHADPGADEMSWLSSALKSAGASPVWVIAHVPPGIDVFATLQWHAPAPVSFLSDRFTAPFVSTLTAHAGNIVMTLAGHTHMEGFHILGQRAGDASVPMLIVPSISPIFYGNPAFTILDVDRTSAQVLDSEVYTLGDLSALAKNGRGDAQWKREYSFVNVFGKGAIDAEHLSELQQAIFSDERVRRRFDSFHDGGSGRAPITEATWRAYWCSNVALAVVDYLACSSPQIQTQLPPHPSAPPPPTPTPSPTPTASPSPSPSP